MRTIFLIGGLAVGIIYYAFEWYCNRENQHAEAPYGSEHTNRFSGDEEYVIINKTASKPGGIELPGREDNCSVCLDPLIRRDEDERGYAIIALPKCKHWLHQKCAIRLLEYHPNCPVCREPIDNAALRGTPVKVFGALGGQNGTQASSSNNVKKND